MAEIKISDEDVRIAALALWWLEWRASEAEQYVSAGTREGEDQKRGEEQEHG
jgi:hypothetical protein